MYRYLLPLAVSGSLIIGLFGHHSVTAQPPNRDLLPYDTWTLPGYEARQPGDFLSLPAGEEIQVVSDAAFTADGHLLLLTRDEIPFMEFDAEGNFLRRFGSPELFSASHGLTIAPDGTLWVTDFRDNVVMQLDRDGNVLLELGKRGEAGEWNEATGSHLFDQPNEVAFDSMGNVYVAQGHVRGEPRVLKFTPDGSYIGQWGKRGSGREEMAVAHSIVIDADDRVYVADRENQRIVITDTGGNVLDIHEYSAMVCSLFLHNDGTFYVTSGFDGQVARLDAEGRLSGALGSPGTENGQHGEAHYVVVDAEHNIYVTDVSKRPGLQIFEMTGPSPEPVRRFRFNRPPPPPAPEP